MTELGRTLRAAREAAGLSLSGMARRTGYSDSYLGNVETGVRAATPKLIRAYERVLGDGLNRRTLLLGLTAGIAGAALPSAAPETAVDVFRDIAAERSRLLSSVQTSHETDKAIGFLVSRDVGAVGSLARWARSGNAFLRVNSVGILAKVGSAALDSSVAASLRSDRECRDLYMTAVSARVLRLPWDEAQAFAAGHGRLEAGHVAAFSTEVTNVADSGARLCAAIMLGRARHDYPNEVTAALRTAVRDEQSVEHLRVFGYILAGADPHTFQEES